MSSLNETSSLEITRPRPSTYLTDAYYSELIAWRDEAATYGPATQADVVAECTSFLNYEARLLDTRRFADWLDLFTLDCVYWVPAAPDGDPRREVTVSFDDHRRLEDRIIRFETGFAHNQEPGRRLRRIVSNVEAWEADDGLSRRIMANAHVFEARNAKPRSEFVVGLDYWLARSDESSWKIRVKRSHLINSQDGLEAPTFL